MNQTTEPSPARHPTKLSIELERLRALCQRETLTVDDLLHDLSIRSSASFALFFALPFLLPFSIPGLSSILGGLIVVIGIAVMFNRPPWMPARLRQRKIKLELFAKVLARINPHLHRIEKILRPRGGFYAGVPFLRFLHGTVFAIAGFILALPLPPGMNLPPAVVITFLSLGIIEEDDLFITLSYSMLGGGLALAWWFFDLLQNQVTQILA